MLHTGSNEEIENCSMHSEDISNNDIEGLEELSHKVDIHLHEGDGDNEVKKKETIESDITHEKKSKNDETEVESNGKRIRRPIEILMGGLNMISLTQTLKKDEVNI